VRKLIIVLVFFALLIGACNALLPERFAVKGPMLHGILGRSAGPPAADQIANRMQGPPGFGVGIWAEGLPGVRMLRFTTGGDLIVSLPREGRVVLLARDADADGRSDGTRDLLTDLDRPSGLELRHGFLYVGEGSAVGRIRFDERGAKGPDVSGDYEHIITGLPSGGNHSTRTVRVGPDDKLYVSVGSSCNVCIEDEPNRRAAMLRFEIDGTGEETFAIGLRNTVGFDWQPGTNDLYGTDNGRDLLGDDFPPCELNRIVLGADYGWPFANGDRVPDPDYGDGQSARIAASIPPAHDFRAHNAPLGITFLRGAALPAAYHGAALAALHGSWNRTELDGYKVVSLHWQPDGSIEERDFLVGFEENEDVIGRPVDVAEGPDGSIYVSDDFAGVIWRVGRGGASQSSAVPRAGRSSEGHLPRGEVALAALSPETRSRLASEGERLFATNECGTCHLAELATEGMVTKPLAGLARRHDPESLTALLETPTPPMPVAPMTDAQRTALGIYLLETFGD